MKIKFNRRKGYENPYVIAYVTIGLDVGVQLSGVMFCREQKTGDYFLKMPRKVIGDRLIILAMVSRELRQKMTTEVVGSYKYLKEQGLWEENQ